MACGYFFKIQDRYTWKYLLLSELCPFLLRFSGDLHRRHSSLIPSTIAHRNKCFPQNFHQRHQTSSETVLQHLPNTNNHLETLSLCYDVSPMAPPAIVVALQPAETSPLVCVNTCPW